MIPNGTLEILYRNLHSEIIDYDLTLKVGDDNENFWLSDIYRAIIPGESRNIKVSMSGHLILIENMIGMRIIFSCGDIYIGSKVIHTNTEKRTINLLRHIIFLMKHSRNRLKAIIEQDHLEKKKKDIISEIVSSTAGYRIRDLLRTSGLKYNLSKKQDEVSLSIELGPRCLKEFKFRYDFFDEDYEEARKWIEGLTFLNS